VGIPMRDHMIASTRKLYDAYNLDLAGVPSHFPTPLYNQYWSIPM